MPRWVPIAAVVLAIGGVVAYGLFRPAAAPGRDPADVQARFNAVPRDLGPWHNTADTPLTGRTLETGRIEAYLSRSYVNTKTGAQLTVLVVYGESGDVGTHDPTVCYAGSGYERCEIVAKVRISDTTPPAELWASKFKQKEQPVRVYWGWAADGGGWQAADDPRFTFATHRRLYKLYAQSAETAGASDPVADFLPTFLPALADALPPSGPR